MFLEVLIVFKELNQLFKFDKMRQLMIIRTSVVQVHLKPYKGESYSII